MQQIRKYPETQRRKIHEQAEKAAYGSAPGTAGPDQYSAGSCAAANVAGVYFAETIDNYVTGTHLDTSEKATAAVMETGEKVAERIAAEGAVLLKNDGALPLASDVTKVNVFGWGSTQWLGSGSGSGRVVSTDTGLLDALEAAGIDYNSELTDMYKAFQPSVRMPPIRWAP